MIENLKDAQVLQEIRMTDETLVWGKPKAGMDWDKRPWKTLRPKVMEDKAYKTFQNHKKDGPWFVSDIRNC